MNTKRSEGAIESTNSYARAILFISRLICEMQVKLTKPSKYIIICLTMSEGGNDNSQQSAASLLSNELLELCKSESLSAEELLEIIQRHGLTHDNPLSDYNFFLAACRNENVTEEIIRCLLEYFPDATSATDDEDGCLPLHFACYNKNVTLNIIQLIIDAAPATVRSVTNHDSMPLHVLCRNHQLDEMTSIEILKLLIEKYPAAVRHANNDGALPIHRAAGWKSAEICRVLIKAYPGSERVTDVRGKLPLHWACYGSLQTVEYLYRLYPDAIDTKTTDGYGVYPIHFVISSTSKRDNPGAAVEVIQFLLNCDPNQKLIPLRGWSLLHIACVRQYTDLNIEAGIQIVKIVFDAHPEAIEDNQIGENIHRYHQRIQAFINGELVYARQAKDLRLMMTLDINGQLPLHTALQNNVRLGSIKLLVKGNPSALQTVERNLAMPLHIACQYHDSASVVKYLLSLSATILDAVDRKGNTVLHYACRGSKHGTIALLLEKYDAASVSKRNTDGKLPIDLLWESNAVSDRESAEYTGSVFRLVRAYPEMVTISNLTRK